jgi:hypothetical protein
VTTRLGVFLRGARALSAALGEDVRAIPVHEVRRPPLRVIVYDETPDAKSTRASTGEEDGAGRKATRREFNEPDCLFSAPIESQPCVGDRGRAGAHPSSPQPDSGQE